jgi:multisubunit Na+/H+ antiporter MnhC subunit
MMRRERARLILQWSDAPARGRNGLWHLARGYRRQVKQHNLPIRDALLLAAMVLAVALLALWGNPPR